MEDRTETVVNGLKDGADVHQMWKAYLFQAQAGEGMITETLTRPLVFDEVRSAHKGIGNGRSFIEPLPRW